MQMVTFLRVTFHFALYPSNLAALSALYRCHFSFFLCPLCVDVVPLTNYVVIDVHIYVYASTNAYFPIDVCMRGVSSYHCACTSRNLSIGCQGIAVYRNYHNK